MRVAILSLYPLDPQLISGGVRGVARYLVDGLRAYPDLELVVVHCHSDMNEDRHLVHDGVPVHYLALSRRRVIPNTLRGIPRAEQVLRELAPDVVSAHTAPFALAALRAGLPTLWTNHGVQPLAWSGWGAVPDLLRYRLAVALQEIALHRARHLVAISAYAEAAYARRSRGRWYRIANPVPDDLFAVPADPGGEAEPVLLFAGTISPVKDLLTLVRALARLRVRVPAARLEIAGRVNSPAYEALLKNEIAMLGLGGAVHFHGLLARPELLAAFSRAVVVVLPSRWENSPLAIAEAMAAGRAVAATRVGGVPELVSDGRTGLLVPAQDPDGLADVLRTLLQNPLRRQVMGHEARRVAGERFRIAAVAARYRQALYEVAGRPLPPDAGAVDRPV